MILVGSAPLDGPTWHQNRIQIDQKSIQKGIETKMQFGLRFGALLERFLVDFGAKLGPSWVQVGTKIWKIGVSRRCQKNDQKKSMRECARKVTWGGFPTSPLRVLFS